MVGQLLSVLENVSPIDFCPSSVMSTSPGTWSGSGVAAEAGEIEDAEFSLISTIRELELTQSLASKVRDSSVSVDEVGLERGTFPIGVFLWLR